MKEHMPYQADTTRLRSRTQNICFLISISAAILKLMVKITSNSAHTGYHDIFSLSFRSLSNQLEFEHPPVGLGVEEQMLIFSSKRVNDWNPVPKLTIALKWKSIACLKFGKTSNRAEEY